MSEAERKRRLALEAAGGRLVTSDSPRTPDLGELETACLARPAIVEL